MLKTEYTENRMRSCLQNVIFYNINVESNDEYYSNDKNFANIFYTQLIKNEWYHILLM